MNFDQTLIDLDNAIENSPSAENYYNRAQFIFDYFTENNFENGGDKIEYQSQILEDLNKAIKINHNYADAYFLRGLILRSSDDKDQAFYDFSRAIANDDSLAEAHFQLGDIYFENEEYQDALESLTKAITLDSSNGVFYHLRSQVYSTLEEYSEADIDYDKSVELLGDNHPDKFEIESSDPEIENGWSICQDENGMMRLSLGKSMKIIPLNIYCQSGSKCYKVQESNGKIVEHCLLHICEHDENKNNPIVLHFIGITQNISHIDNDYMEKALINRSDLLKSDSDLLYALYNRGILYKTMEDYESAMQDFMQIKRIGTSLLISNGININKEIKEIQIATGMKVGFWDRVKNMFS